MARITWPEILEASESSGELLFEHRDERSVVIVRGAERESGDGNGTGSSEFVVWVPPLRSLFVGSRSFLVRGFEPDVTIPITIVY